MVAFLVASCVSTSSGVTSGIVTTLPGAAPTPPHTGTVTRVVDGDTAYVLFRGRDVTIRLIGIDTPETVAPGQPVECYGAEASQFTTTRLTGTRVRLEFDVDRIDPYGRTLAYVWMPDGSLFNETLVRRGFATVATYPPDTRYVDRFEATERRAMAADRGLWGVCGGG